MNKANKEMRARTAIDLLNACMLLIKLECVWFYKMKQYTWGGTSVLTPRGIEEYEATFTNLSPSHFIINLRDIDDHWQVRVMQHNVLSTKEQIGTCTCGADKMVCVKYGHKSEDWWLLEKS